MAKPWRQRLGEAVKALRGLEEARSWGQTTIDSDDSKFRRLSGATRDLPSITQERVLEIAYYLYKTNPMAYRLVELTKDFCVGSGITWQVVHPNKRTTAKITKRVLQKHWDDPINDWNMKQHSKALELGLYGEQCWPVFINPINGHVRLGYVDPALIQEVKANKDNAEVLEWVIVKPDAYSTEGKPYRIIYLDEDPRSPTYGQLVGDCFYFSVNRVSNATRGHSDLLPLADWLDATDQYLFDFLDYAALIRAFVWDVTFEGLTEDEIKKRLAEMGVPKPGSVRGHNEKVTWAAVTPGLEAVDYAEGFHLLRDYVLAGAGVPPPWIGEGMNVNRAAAAEMATPALKRLEARQRYFLRCVEHVLTFQVHQAVKAGALPASALNCRIVVTAPALEAHDLDLASDAFGRIAKGIVDSLSTGVLDLAGGQAAMKRALAILGIDWIPPTPAPEEEPVEAPPGEEAEGEEEEDGEEVGAEEATEITGAAPTPRRRQPLRPVRPGVGAPEQERQVLRLAALQHQMAALALDGLSSG